MPLVTCFSTTQRQEARLDQSSKQITYIFRDKANDIGMIAILRNRKKHGLTFSIAQANKSGHFGGVGIREFIGRSDGRCTRMVRDEVSSAIWINEADFGRKKQRGR